MAQNISRRVFVKGVLASALVASSSLNLNASTKISSRKETQELSGTEFNLTIDKIAVNITGETSCATAVNSMIAGPTLRWREGDEVTINVTNKYLDAQEIKKIKACLISSKKFNLVLSQELQEMQVDNLNRSQERGD